MERKIGEIFEYNGDWYQCVVGIQGCRECSFRTQDNCKRFSECFSVIRSDKKSVIFKKLEKVGEPTVIRGKPHQKFNNFVFRDSRICQYCAFHHKLCDVKCEPYEFYLEIKQNKEDMEKKNLRPFDLQKARAGKPVCTRDGRKARIVCFDLQSIEKTPIVAAVQVTDKQEVIANYYENGQQFINGISELDLMMLPEKKEGWVNMYKDGLLDTKSYPTKKEAFDKASPKDYVDTIKINWSE